MTLEKVKNIFDRIDVMSFRERLVIMIAILALVFMAWDGILLKDQLKVRSDFQEKISLLDVDLQTHKSAKIVLEAKVKQDPSVIERQKLERYQIEIDRIDAILKEKTFEFISPQQMVEVLRNLVAAENGLRLVSLESTEPRVPMIEGASEEGEGKTEPVVEEIITPTVYLHGLEMNFKGDYMSVLNYIRRLESLKWRFAWDSFEISLDKYPMTDAYIRLETLSLTEGWIGV